MPNGGYAHGQQAAFALSRRPCEQRSILRAFDRRFAGWVARGSVCHLMLEGINYWDAVAESPSQLETCFAILAHVLELDDQGDPVNEKHAERRAANGSAGTAPENYRPGKRALNHCQGCRPSGRLRSRVPAAQPGGVRAGERRRGTPPGSRRAAWEGRRPPMAWYCRLATAGATRSWLSSSARRLARPPTSPRRKWLSSRPIRPTTAGAAL